MSLASRVLCSLPPAENLVDETPGLGSISPGLRWCSPLESTRACARPPARPPSVFLFPRSPSFFSFAVVLVLRFARWSFVAGLWWRRRSRRSRVEEEDACSVVFSPCFFFFCSEWFWTQFELVLYVFVCFLRRGFPRSVSCLRWGCEMQNCISESWTAGRIRSLVYCMVSAWIFCFWYLQSAVFCEEWKCDDVVCCEDEEVKHFGCRQADIECWRNVIRGGGGGSANVSPPPRDVLVV